MNAKPVIMVDDNEADLFIAGRCYRDAGLPYPWLTFQSGPQLLAHLQLVKTGQFDMPAIVLLDINMPSMSGLEVLERTRQDEFFARLPMFCMLTSSSDPRDEATAKDLGATGFMIKPARLEDYGTMFHRLDEMLDK